MKSIFSLVILLLGCFALSSAQSPSLFAGTDNIGTLPGPHGGGPTAPIDVSGGGGGGGSKKTPDPVWLKPSQSYRGFMNVTNKSTSQGDVKVAPMKGGGSATGKSGASFEVDGLTTGETVNVGAGGHADVEGTGGAVNLTSGGSAHVSNTGGPDAGTITVTQPGGGHTDFGPGQSGTVYG